MSGVEKENEGLVVPLLPSMQLSLAVAAACSDGCMPHSLQRREAEGMLELALPADDERRRGRQAGWTQDWSMEKGDGVDAAVGRAARMRGNVRSRLAG
jgi:hypothetical protein